MIKPSPTFKALEHIRHELAQLKARGLQRSRRLLESPQGAHVRVDGRAVLSFCSNDYLGLASHHALISAAGAAAQTMGVGAGASHLITGHHAVHHALETRFAEFVGLPAALLFSTGYMANIGVVTALVGRGGEVFADRLNHASLNDAALLSRAKFTRYPHNDLAALETRLTASRASQKLVLADAVFSMDGDLAPLPDLLALCERYDAWLLVDDAHGFGVLGPGGRGALAHFGLASPRIVYMATLGKAAGVFGAVVAGEAEVIEWLLQKARTYIYTTATPPLLSATLLASLDLIEAGNGRRTHLQKLIVQLRAGLCIPNWQLMDSPTPIQPVLIGSNDAALAASQRLLERGILVPAIRPPTVPASSARLRISLSAAHTETDVAQLVDALNSIHADG
ncbi:8-amino-7-oxononanoate synthase [Sulfuriferula plumbiphila]|uniref:8-amino-7-oxononanoate synthase n=1 Tax=Sulfuriferula plumbiphila TaxID=171865 RepID=A0A512L812_9PROT|nr:8-amino-7-oxononanoate synthase [Sulfuriferula plumbiphila]BBP02852.1 8-amino-7-oxononanoate synthase [Sulfuriferula plumbiphila]GEP30281.1 8-amino-7-oxononanoate synthase [Sulfuriferula plumbiphila]